MKIKDVLGEIRALAPEDGQSAWDNSGVQVAGTLVETDKVAVCLEPAPDMVGACLDWGAGAVVTHHPLYMKPVSLGAPGRVLDVARRVMVEGAWLYAAHTSLDVRPGGPAFWLGSELGLRDALPLEKVHARCPVEASFYLDEPISRATADIWSRRESIHSVSQSGTGEVRVVCDEADWPSVAEAIVFAVGSRPVFYLRKLCAPCDAVGFGEVGDLPEPMDFEAFSARLDGLLPAHARGYWTVSGPRPGHVARVAYCGGSGAGLAAEAARAGADLFITGDMKYHAAVEAGVCVLDVGHFSLEEEMMRRFALELSGRLSGVEVRFFPGSDPFLVRIRA
ncbi:Nif3-like dinuclear metal center hexameric protein [Pseudodesulfovibrio sp. F-1]|uniref:GTP cyclohydrolase 1 type 2 homolog n=1 Tax=Pseudodesulfovibrio alkaliphilus TaxID=2661613 RepID=A0A7K1KMG2_9BACT|nr:Nif3-like dinuclear metal center hexameric protein [Pseudodesulfovibrio alkaliphilus]MUM77230.1 Nif3-like dinuclear metal center hexameric protein [Pseudodesulfovibrio alkaliphilus]